MKKITQNLRWLVTLLVMIVCTGAWAEEVTVSMTSFSAISGYIDDDTNVSYEAAKGEAGTAPAVNNGQIRVYQNGGLFTITANNGKKLKSITLGSAMATSVSYKIDGGTESETKTIDKNGTLTVEELEATTVVFTCKGTDKNSRLYVNSLSVTYYSVSDKETPTVTISSNTIEIGKTATVTTNGPALTLTSSDNEVASVSGNIVTANGAGTATITAAWEENDDYDGGTKTFEITVPNAIEDGVFDFTGTNSYGTGLVATNDGSYITESKTWTAGNVTLVTSGKYRWWSTDGTLRVFAPTEGNTTLTLSVPEGYVMTKIEIEGNSDCSTLTANTGSYSNTTWTGSSNTVVLQRGNKNAQIKTITVTYEEGTSDPVKEDIATINSLEPTEVETGTTGTFKADITLAEGVASNEYEVTYSSSDDNVIAVESDGTYLVGESEGTATITVHVEALDDESYNSVDKEFTVTVTAPVVPAETFTFVKVTSTDDITDGDYLIVYEEGSVAFNGALETLDAVSNTIDVEMENNTITCTDKAVFTINTTEGSIKSASGKYIGVSSNSNGLKQTDSADTYSHTFSIDDDNNAVISATFDGSTMTLRYNSDSNQKRFRYYRNSGQQAIQLYKKVVEEETVDVTVTAAGYATYSNPEVNLDFSNVEGLTAYYVKSAPYEGNLVIEEAGKVPAGTAVLLAGAEGTYYVPVCASAEEPTTNLLQVADDSTVGNGESIFVLANGNKGVGFYVVKDGSSIPAGKAYLVIEKPADGQTVKSFFSLGGDDANAINGVEAEVGTGIIYNLNGQRVAAPVKGGLYIVNGKKVMVK